MSLIAVEGPSFAGKSTLLVQMAARFATVAIGEHHDYISAGSRPDPKTEKDAYANADFYISLEKKRAIDIRAALNQHRLVFSDRSVVSLVAYQLALDATKGEIPEATVAVTDYVIRLAQQEIEDGKIEIPDGIIILRTADEATHNLRVEERGRTSEAIFNQYSFSLAIGKTTVEACSLVCPSVPTYTIVSKNTEGAREQSLREAVGFIEDIMLGLKDRL